MHTYSRKKLNNWIGDLLSNFSLKYFSGKSFRYFIILIEAKIYY